MVYAFWPVEESTWVTLNLLTCRSAEKSSDEMKCGVWRVKCEVWGVKSAVWSVKCGVWRKQWEVRSVKCGLWSVKCGVWSVDWGECSVNWEVWSVDCEGCGVKCEDCQVWSVTWGFKCDMWNTTSVSQSARTHGLGWRTAHASSMRKVLYIYIFKATSAPPRAGTTGIYICIHIMCIYICILCSIILSSRFPPKKNRSLPSSPCFFADHSEVASPNKPPRDQRRTIPSWTLLTSREGHEADDFSAKLGVLTVI